MSFNLTNKNIQDTFQNLLQRTGSDNRLYDLTGNEIGDLRISGSLIAQQYIVSSSVTNITTQQLSGSTQFGDSLDDTHQFTGSLNVTGSITKGSIPFVLSNQTGSFVTNIDSPSQGNVRKTDAVTGVGSNISLGLRTTDNVKFNHITASGNISSSGNLTTIQITSSGHFIGQLPPDGGDNVLRYLKTSGDASSVKIEMGDLTGDAGGETKLVLDDAATKVDITGNLLVSGILSSSGDLTSRGGTIERGFVVNNDGGAFATIIKGNTDDNLFLANVTPSGIDKVAIGTNSFLSKLTIDGDLTTTSHITASGDIKINGDILNTETFQMTATSDVINTFNTGSHQTCKYLLQVTSGSYIQSSEMLVMQNSSNAFNTEYAQINSGLNLVDFSSKVNGANIELIGSSSFISCSVKFNRVLI